MTAAGVYPMSLGAHSVSAWSAFDMRMMFQGYAQRGFGANDGDVEILTKLLGHAPHNYRDFARETAAAWQNGDA